MLRRLIFLLAFFSLLSCGSTDFSPSQNAPKLSANDLGVFYFFPSEEIPKGSQLIGTWEFSDNSGKEDIQLERILDRDARKRGANVVHLEKIEAIFGGQRLVAKYYYHDDLAAVRYHINEVKNQRGLNQCNCTEMHFFRYQKEEVKGPATPLSIVANGNILGELEVRDTLTTRVPLGSPILLSVANSDTLKITPRANQEYFVEIFEPQKSSLFFTGDGFMVMYYLSKEVMVMERKGMLSRWRYDEFRQNILRED